MSLPVTLDRHDRHPDPLVAPYDRTFPQPGWFFLTAYAHMEHASARIPSMVSMRGYFSVLTVSDDEQRRDPKMCYQHPSEEYLREVARQLHRRERDVLLNSGTSWHSFHAAEVYLWQYDDDAFVGDDRARRVEHFPCTRCVWPGAGTTMDQDASAPRLEHP
jgi:hypothetical protein